MLEKAKWMSAFRWEHIAHSRALVATVISARSQGADGPRSGGDGAGRPAQGEPKEAAHNAPGTPEDEQPPTPTSPRLHVHHASERVDGSVGALSLLIGVMVPCPRTRPWFLCTRR